MSGIGNLSQCIVYGDAVEAGRARWLRGRSVAASLTIETAIVAVLLIWPLLTTAVLPGQHVSPPVPVFRPTPPPTPPTVREQQHAPRTPAIWVANSALRQPPSIPTHIAAQVGDAPQLDFSGSPAPGIGTLGSGNTAVAPPEAKPHANAPIKMSGGVMAARLVRSVQPDYPAIARAMHLTGAVQLRAIIGVDGAVQNIEVTSGNPILARAAVAAVREWRYQPTLLSGKPVEVETVITVQFQMEQ